MRNARATVLLTILAIVVAQGALPDAGHAADTVIGVLSYQPAPNLAICFCGSFRLTVEGALKECYLLSDLIDLREFDGQRILVIGKSFSGFCSGTLERPCNFMDVEKVAVLSRTGVAGVDWGALKTIYR
jgi:hypothetical protein